MVHLLQKGNCFGKLTNITFANELNSIILEHFKQNPQSGSLDIKLHNFCSDWVQINHFSQEIFSGKMENFLLLLCTCCVLSYYSISRKFSETKSSKRLHNFVPNLAWVDFSIKNEFIRKVDQYFIGLLYPVMLHNFKKILWEQIIRLHNFCPNCCLPQKRIFLENWLVSNYFTPLC